MASAASSSSASYQSSIISARLFNRALSAADVLALSLYGINAADEWGSMVPSWSSDFSAGVDGTTATRATLDGNIDAINGQDNTLRFTIDGTAASTHSIAKAAGIIAGKRYKLTASVYIPTGRRLLTELHFASPEHQTCC